MKVEEKGKWECWFGRQVRREGSGTERMKAGGC